MKSTFELDKAGLARYCQTWLAASNNTHKVDRAQVTNAVEKIYECMEKQPPHVVLCQSPWQMIMMTAALERGLDEETANSFKQPEQNPFAVPEWRFLWMSLWKTLQTEVKPELREKLMGHGKKSGWDYLTSSTAGKIGAGNSSLLMQMNDQLLKRMKPFVAASFDAPVLDRVRSRYGAQFPQAWPNGRMLEQIRLSFVSDTVGSQPFAFDPDFMTPLASLVPRFASIAGHFANALFPNSVGEGGTTLWEFSLLSLSALNNLILTRSLLGPLPLYQFLLEQSDTVPSVDTIAQMHALLQLARCTPFALVTDDVCFVCEPPQIFAIDGEDRLHAESGPALAFSDGFKVFSLQGVTVPRQMMENPESVTAEQILRQQNVEVRRVMINHFGAGRFLKDIGAQRIHEDECGILYRKNIHNEEPLVMVKVINSTPEPDGTKRTYYMRVPPHIETAREAVAWTFNIPGDEYQPTVET